MIKILLILLIFASLALLASALVLLIRLNHISKKVKELKSAGGQNGIVSMLPKKLLATLVIMLVKRHFY